MIYSMTGYGRAEHADSDRVISVELRSVNHRYLDINLKMPRRFIHLDAHIRSFLKERIGRGKLDVFITSEELDSSSTELSYNAALAGQYVARAKEIHEQYGIPNDLSVARLMRFQDVMSTADLEIDEDRIKEQLTAALSDACEAFLETRKIEGEKLRTDILDKLGEMRSLVEQVKEREPMIMAAHRERIEEKVHELLGDVQIDESRLAAEMVLFADKICTDEETVRLLSHIDSVEEILKKGGAVGRKLDFMAQEMNREANTILSKANDLITSDQGIELKSVIEKIREQIQNIE